MPDLSREEELARSEAAIDADLAAKRKRRGAPSGLISKSPARAANSITPDPANLVEPIEGPEGPRGPAGSNGGGNSQYATANYSKQIFMALSLSILFVLLTAYARKQGAKEGSASQLVNPTYDPGKFLLAWATLFVVLLGASTFRGPDKVAAAFSWLIFVAVLLVGGETALEFIKNKLVTPESGGTGGKKKI